MTTDDHKSERMPLALLALANELRTTPFVGMQLSTREALAAALAACADKLRTLTFDSAVDVELRAEIRALLGALHIARLTPAVALDAAAEDMFVEAAEDLAGMVAAIDEEERAAASVYQRLALSGMGA